MGTSDAVVVGAGVVGCATAFWLARAGLSVTLLERDGLAQHASSVPACLLAPLELGDAGPAVRAGWDSLTALQEIESELEDVASLEPRIGTTGVLRLASDSDFGAWRDRLPGLSDYDCEWFDRADLERFDARLRPHWSGGFWSPRECRVDAGRLARAFARGAEHYGAQLVFGAPVVGVAMSHGCVAGALVDGDRLYACGDLIVCAGRWSPAIASWIDASLSLRPVSGSLLQLVAPQPGLSACVSAAGVQLIPEDGGLWVGHSGASDADGLAVGAGEVVRAFANLERGGVWSGECAATSDGMPVVGRVPDVEGALLATGHGRHGALFCALSAQGVVELIVEGQLGEDTEVLALDRFA